MHGSADKTESRWMDGAEARRQVDVVFGIGQLLLPQAIKAATVADLGGIVGTHL